MIHAAVLFATGSALAVLVHWLRELTRGGRQ
jgi:hypothetical protein